MFSVAFCTGRKCGPLSTFRLDRNPIRLDEMKQTSTDIALLENALATIERVLAHADSELQGAPYRGSARR
jgi:hypothetical protein